MKKVGFFVGSLRNKSFNMAIAKYMASVAPTDVEVQIVEIGQLPFFTEDMEATPPQEWVDFRTTIQNLDGYVFFTPEYNRSFPAVLKNALDVGSRPYGQNSWDGKPGAVVGVSLGSMGAFGACQHLMHVLSFLNIYTMHQPEAYIGNIMASVDENGAVTNAETQQFIKSIIEAFSAWMDNFS